MYSHTVHSWCVVFSAGSCCKAALWFFCLFVFNRWFVVLNVLGAESRDDLACMVPFSATPGAKDSPRFFVFKLCEVKHFNVPDISVCDVKMNHSFVNLRAELGDRPGVRRKLPGVMRCFVVFPPDCCRCALLKSHECLHLKRR